MPRDRSYTVAAIAAALSAGLIAAPSVRAQLGWLPSPVPAFPASQVYDFINFDPDGPGPRPEELVVAGMYFSIDGVSLDGARWDGVEWSPLLQQVNTDSITSLTVFDLDGDGPNPPRLIAAGRFSFLPGTAEGFRNIVATDGDALFPLYRGIEGNVNDVAVFDPDGDGPAQPRLFAAGDDMTHPQGHDGTVFCWNGAAWENVSPAGADYANALWVADLDGPGAEGPRLIAAGRGTPSAVWAYDGASWIPLGSLGGPVMALDVFDLDGDGPNPPRLVTASNGNQPDAFKGQAYFDGDTWRPIVQMASDVQFTCLHITNVEIPGEPPRLLLAGLLWLPGHPEALTRLAELRNGAWAPVVQGEYISSISTIGAVRLPNEPGVHTLVGGTMSRRSPHEVRLQLARIEGYDIQPFHEWFGAYINNMTVATFDGAPWLVAVGRFSQASGAPGAGIARFDGEAWSALPGAFQADGPAEQVIAFDPDGEGPLGQHVVVGGPFTAFAGVDASNVVMFDGEKWSAMGRGLESKPQGFAVFDADGEGPQPGMLYASGGVIADKDGERAMIHRWNGAEWEAVPGTFTNVYGGPQTLGMTTFDPDADGPQPRRLVVIGTFTRVDAVNANNMAAYDGKTWSSLGLPPKIDLRTVFAWDRSHDGREVIVVGGPFISSESFSGRAAAVWNGATWESLGSGFGHARLPGNFPRYPSSFEVYNDRLYATGNFNRGDYGPANYIARWNGTTWESLEGELDQAGNVVKVLPAHQGRAAMLTVAGGFRRVNGVSSAPFARYRRIPRCPADHDENEVVNSADFFSFLNDFFAEDPAGDFNHDEVVNSQDFFDFLAAFFSGC